MKHGFWMVLLAAAGAATAQTHGATDQRIASIEQRLKQTPRESSLRDDLAGAYLQKMRETSDGSYLDRADRIVAGILKDQPEQYEARRRWMEIQMQRHHFAQVIALARRMVGERPDDAAVWGMMGDAQMETGDYDAAADTYQMAVDLRPNLTTYNRVAFYRFVTGDADGGIDIMRLAIRSDSREAENVAWCLAELGRMLLKTGSTGEAEVAFAQALTRFPGYHPAVAGLGRVQAIRGNYREAIPLLLAAQAKAPFPEYTALLARLYGKIGNREAAEQQIALLDVADRLDRAAGQNANRTLSLAYSDLGHRVERALELAQAELQVRQDVYSYDALAWALFRNGRIAESVEAMEKALIQHSPEPLFEEHAARIFAAAGKAEEAQRHGIRVRENYWQ